MGSRSSKRSTFKPTNRKSTVGGIDANDIALQGKPLYKKKGESAEDGRLENCSSLPCRTEEEDAERALNNDGDRDEEVGDGEREVWAKKVDFLLSVIGFAVDLANVWRFPYLCYKNGGGAFLVPYTLMLVLAGIPLFYMELALGQFNRKGAITCWGRICPLFRGVGYAVVLIAFYTDFFYNVIIAWSIYYFFASFTLTLPWTTCNNTWNTPSCYDGDLRSDLRLNESAGFFYEQVEGRSNASSSTGNASAASGGDVIVTMVAAAANNVTGNVTIGGTSPALEYFERAMLELQHSEGVGHLGHIKWQLALCLLVVYLICYFSLWKGISTSGKVVWFTALFPYVVLSILLVRGITLAGAADGIRYYLTPDFSKLTDSGVWVDAATQVFFSLGPGFGVLLAFASYNKFHNNVYWDALATSSINCMTSFWAGFVIFSVLGYMSKRSGKPIDKVATEGPGLVFVVYPEAIATLPFSTFWSLIFFLMLITLGLDSSFGGSEAIITALSDEFPIIKNNREIFIACLFTFYFIIGLPSCAQGGVYIVTLMDRYAAGYSILFAVFFETLAISWFYGVDRFAEDISAMLGFRPGIYWRICWKFIAPIFLLCIIVFGFVWYEPLKYDTYEYPVWANLIGWAIALSSILCMPILAIAGLIFTPGSLRERFRRLIMPWRDTQKNAVVGNENRANGNSQEVI